jgi:crotonobetainyl-CoA:carnitine CoA-transferase CaiB-like acyl-CoA transferase
LTARGRWREIGSPAGPLRAIVPPLDLEGMEPRMGAVPGVGQHTDEILVELGFDAAAIRGLREAGAV